MRARHGFCRHRKEVVKDFFKLGPVDALYPERVENQIPPDFFQAVFRERTVLDSSPKIVVDFFEALKQSVFVVFPVFFKPFRHGVRRAHVEVQKGVVDVDKNRSYHIYLNKILSNFRTICNRKTA